MSKSPLSLTDVKTCCYCKMRRLGSQPSRLLFGLIGFVAEEGDEIRACIEKAHVGLGMRGSDIVMKVSER